MAAASVSRETWVRRGVRLMFAASALGELAVGIAAAVFPGAVTGFLLGAPVDGTGTVVARMAGIAVAALGLGWWIDKDRLDDRRLRQIAAGFTGYNLGVGLLFLGYAWNADRALPVSWLVAAVHLLVAGAYVTALVCLAPAARGR
jgi:hypothetical protein